MSEMSQISPEEARKRAHRFVAIVIALVVAMLVLVSIVAYMFGAKLPPLAVVDIGGTINMPDCIIEFSALDQHISYRDPSLVGDDYGDGEVYQRSYAGGGRTFLILTGTITNTSDKPIPAYGIDAAPDFGDSELHGESAEYWLRDKSGGNIKSINPRQTCEFVIATMIREERASDLSRFVGAVADPEIDGKTHQEFILKVKPDCSTQCPEHSH